MSEELKVEKKERTLEDIKQEYGNYCLQAGDLNYKIFTHNKDLEIVNSRMRDLNFEAAALQGAQAKEAPPSE